MTALERITDRARALQDGDITYRGFAEALDDLSNTPEGCRVLARIAAFLLLDCA
jgi:hypothetical protein